MGTPVEVKDLETFGYYPAFAKDVKEGYVLVSFENNWKPDVLVPLEHVRKAPIPFNPATFQLREGDIVEAMAKSADNEPFSWWRATVKTVKGDFIYVSFGGWGPEHDQLLEKEQLRPLNKNPPLTGMELKRATLTIPQDIWNSESRQHVQDFSTYVTAGALAISIDEDGKNLVVIGSSRACDKVLMLAKINFKHLGEIEKLKKKTREHEEKMRKLEERKQKGATEIFSVAHDKLMGFVIGKQGKTIRDAEQIPGINKITVDSKTMTVHISAKTPEAAAEARRRLEFVEVDFPVKRGQIARLIGRNFANLRELEQESKVVRIRAPPDDRKRYIDEKTGEEVVDDNFDDPDEEVNFTIIGTLEAVETAKAGMHFVLSQIAKLTEIMEKERDLRQKRRELEREMGYVTDDGDEEGSQDSQKQRYRRRRQQQQNEDNTEEESEADGNKRWRENKGQQYQNQGQGGRQDNQGQRQNQGNRQQGGRGNQQRDGAPGQYKKKGSRNQERNSNSNSNNINNKMLIIKTINKDNKDNINKLKIRNIKNHPNKTKQIKL